MLSDHLDDFPAVPLPAGTAQLGRRFPAATLLVVEGGPVVVRVAGREHRSVVPLVVAAGGIMFPPGPDDLVEALGEARLRVISIPAAERLLSLPGMATAVLEGLAATARQLQEAAATFANVHHAERVRQKLLQLARTYGRVDSGPGVRIDLPLTHDLLAEMVGSARETVSRAIEDLERVGFVSREGRAYRILARPSTLDSA